MALLTTNSEIIIWVYYLAWMDRLSSGNVVKNTGLSPAADFTKYPPALTNYLFM